MDDTRPLFQGLCLQSSEGRMYMGTYDGMPPEARKRAAYSSYNLCAACIFDVAKNLNNGIMTNESKFLCAAISAMERTIMEQEK